MEKSQLIQETVRRGLGRLSAQGALVVQTGSFTGRAAQSRFIVQRKELDGVIDWGSVNLSVPFDFGSELYTRVQNKIEASEGFSMSGFVGPFKINVSSLSPWHIAFAQNMFRRTPIATLVSRLPSPSTIEVVHDPFGKVSDYGLKGPSETVIILDPVDLRVVIVGTAYAGEIKKSAFTLCNFKLPEYGWFPMHASANCLPDGSSSSVLFGLSGTGKTTLSASSTRSLIGDDEILWTETGLSNLEGGCYAKLIDLDPEKEPEIYRAVGTQGAILENVGCSVNDGRIDFADRSKTENTRGSYDLGALESVYRQDHEAAPPKTIVFLTADAFGALPSVARLDSTQAQYHFLSGYTAKVAGTELGVKEPQAAFSACFGAPFMPRHPQKYADLLASYLERSKASVWLLNTGWTSGGYGKGPRFPIKVSRKLLEQIQTGALNGESFSTHSVFGFQVPKRCDGVDAEYLSAPTGDSVQALAEKFRTNVRKFSRPIDDKILVNGGPRG